MLCPRRAGRRIIAVLLGLLVHAVLAGGALAQDDPAALIGEAIKLAQAGRIDEAIAKQERVIPAIEKMAGKRNPLYPMQIALLGDLYSMKNDYAASERYHLQALKLREELLGPEHVDVAQSLAKLADLYVTTARYAEADRNLKRVIAIRRKSLSQSDPEYGFTFISLGRLAMARSRFAEGAQHFTESLTLFKRHLPADHRYIPLAQNNLAEADRALGRYGVAETLLKEALAGNERINGPDSYLITANLNNLSEFYREQGRYGEAEQLGRRSVAIIEKTLGPDHPTIAINLNNLGVFLLQRGRAEEAVTLLRRVLDIQRKTFGAEHPAVGAALNNLADALGRSQQVGEAEALYRQALAMYERVNGPRDVSVANCLHGFVVFLHRQDRYAEAEPLARRALDIRSETLPPDHPRIAASLSSLAVILDALERHGEARPLHERAVAINRQSFGDNHPETALNLTNLAGNLGDLGDWQSAYDRHLEGNHILIERRAALQDAAPSALTAEADSELRLKRDAFLGQVQAGYALWQKAPATGRGALLDEAFAAHQWASISAAASAVSKMSARIAAGTGPLSDLVREQQDLTGQLGALDKSLVAALSSSAEARNSEGEADLRSRADQVRQRLGAIDADLTARFPEFVALASPRPVGLAEVRRALKREEALYTIALTRHGSFVWVITPEAERWARIERTTAQITDDVAALRCGLDVTGWEAGGKCPELTGRSYDVADVKAGKLPPFDLARANALYRALFAPVEDLIQGRQLIVVPTGPLTQLPFHVLVAGASPPSEADPDAFLRADWLARRTSITVLPAISSLAALRGHGERNAASPAYLGFGNPLLDGPTPQYEALAARARAAQTCAAPGNRGSVRAAGLADRAGKVITTGGLADVRFLRTMSPLPETAEELCAVSSILKAGADAVQLGSAASETNVKRMNREGQLARYRTLHFATHGALAGEAVGLSEPGLLLTPPAKASEADDGYLSASEIGALRLDADLVILSACNTAAGGAGDADTLAGLARSFFYAGARALLVSHWAVYSDATVKLITTALAAKTESPGIDYAGALRMAMLAMIERGSAAEAHPISWAPFVVVGAAPRG